MTDPDTNAESTTTPSSVLCSICLDEIADELNRSKAKLQCGHQFHLDCIGSAFNMKGAMQCPNCRKVEKGRWLNASGPTRSVPDMSMDDWSLREDQYGLRFHDPYWCPLTPFTGLARVHSTLEVMESLPPAYHNSHRHQNLFVEHGAASSGAHSYVAYFGPIPSASSNTNEAIEDPNLSNHWNGVYSAPDMHYYNGFHHSRLIAHANSTDQAPVAPTHRSTRGDFLAMTRSGSHMHPFLHGHGGGRSHERLRSSQTIHHLHQQTNPLPVPPTLVPSLARFPGRALPQPPALTNSVSNHNGSFFIYPSLGSSLPSANGMENSLPVISSDRESRRSSFHNGAGTDSNRTGNFGHRRWS